jgi:hypothetical protein
LLKVAGIRGCTKSVKSIATGIKAYGDEYLFTEKNTDYARNADAYLQTNLLKPKYATKDRSGSYEYVLDSGKPFLVHESANFRKSYIGWNRIGWYSYKWTQGIFGNHKSPDDRWKKFVKETGVTIKEWKSPGDKIIIMGQKEGDSSLTDLYDEGIPNFGSWLQHIVKQIRQHTDRDIIIRPHPRNLTAGLKSAHSIKGKNVYVSENLTVGGNQGGEGLDADLKRAHCVVTYNSLSAIEAVCEGVPVFAMNNGSMVWPIAHRKLRSIENLNYSIDIKQWCNDIAYTQWNKEECAKGEAWAHLRPLIFK